MNVVSYHRTFYIHSTSSLNKESFASSFLICMPFISCACLIALVRTSIKMLNSVGKSRHFCLILDLKGKHLIFHHWVFLAVDFLFFDTHYSLRKFSSVPSLLKVFHINGWNRLLFNLNGYVRCFLCIYWNDLMNFSPLLS